jgi:hypothetical protein
MADLYRTEAGRAAVLARYREMLKGWPPGSEGRAEPILAFLEKGAARP